MPEPRQTQQPANDADAPRRQNIPTRVKDVRRLVASEGPRLQTLLPKNSDVERFGRIYLDAIEGSDDLMNCTDRSIRLGVVKSATVGLEVGGAYPHAWVIPRWNKDLREYEVQFLISVWGFLELIRRTGLVKKVWGDVVRAKDPYRAISGTEGKGIVHTPDWFAPEAERGPIIGSYACALLHNDEVIFEPVSKADLDKARAANKGKTPAWDIWPEQLAIKVALRRLQKYLPKHSLLDLAFQSDADVGATFETTGEAVEEQHEPRGLPIPTGAGEQLQAVVDAARGAQEAVRTRNGAAAGPGPVRASAPPPPPDDGVDRERLHDMLTDADERWAGERARIDAWSEREALSVLMFLRAVFAGDDPETFPAKPECMAAIG